MAKPNRRKRTTLRKVLAGTGLLALLVTSIVLLVRRESGPGSPAASAPQPPPPVSFTHEVRPLLANRCWSCHQADGDARPPLDGEDVGEIFIALAGSDTSLALPDDDIHRTLLSLRERSTLIHWRSEGARHEPHWAYQPLPAQVSPPPSGTAGIDGFVSARRTGTELSKPKRADRLTLLRRVTLDLAGRLPTVAEAEEILAAEDFDQAYRETVERLMTGPWFAGNFSAWWMHTACYADGTSPEESSPFRHWRDWVLRSFHQNRPIDSFLGQQVAGDLLPEGEPVATAIFLSPLRPDRPFALPTDAAYRLGRAFLGHPLDGADAGVGEAALIESLFQSGPPPLPALAGLPPGAPVAILATESQRDEIAAIDAELDALLAQLGTVSWQEDFSQWLAQGDIVPLVPGLACLIDGDTAGPAVPNAALGQAATASAPGAGLVSGVHRKALLLGDGAQLVIEGAPAPSLVTPWTIAFWLRLGESGAGLTRILSAGGGGSGTMLLHDAEILTLCWWNGSQAEALALQTPFPNDHARQWNHVVLTSEGTGQTTGLALYLNGRKTTLTTVRNSLQKLPFTAGQDLTTLVLGQPDPASPPLTIDEFQTYRRDLSPLEARHLWDPETLPTALADSKTHLPDLQRYYLANFHEPSKDLRRQISTTLDRRASIVAGLPTTPVLRTGQRPGPPAPLLAGLLPPEQTPPLETRADLARWLARPDHPLTARAFVNRTWAHFLGQPLVAPVHDLGLESGPCLDPALLDWLARDLVSHDWDFRHLCRRIVSSAHYQEIRSQGHPLPPHVQHDLVIALDPQAAQPRWLNRWHPPTLSETTEATPSPLGDETKMVRLARTLSHDLLRDVPGSDEDRLRHLLLKLRCQDETHPEFKVCLGYLTMRREAAADDNEQAPVVILGPGLRTDPNVDTHEWAIWLDLCSSLLEDPSLLLQR